MKALRMLLTVIAVLFILYFLVLAYHGMFGKVKVTEKQMGPFTIVYESYTGDYKNTGKIFMKVYKDLEKVGIKTINSIGIYYDNPDLVAKDKLRSDLGCVLEEKDLAKAEELKTKFKVMVIEKKDAVVAEFPLKSPLSFMLAPIKAYPVLEKYLQDKNLQPVRMYEFYDMKNKKILITAEVQK
ncbi:MAG: GyrI-like domain-containing protein [Candidatus Margulisbacteria bacterium]|nr:GyrI-like domain-containing protein [Candidatus Margulisiibacteriota bacterium]